MTLVQQVTQLIVAAKEGWANVPPGARTSLYKNANYKDIPFAQMTLDSILSADPKNSTVEPSPYVGVQFAAIPEFAGIATEVSQEFSAAYAGKQSIAAALQKAQTITNEYHGYATLKIRRPFDDGSCGSPPSRMDARATDHDGVLLIQEIPSAARRQAIRWFGSLCGDKALYEYWL